MEGVAIPATSARINQEITAPEVILIDENGKSLGVVSLDQALFLAYEKNVDLVEVAPNAKPPVCKLFDYSKFRYKQEKQERQQRVKGKAPEMKEVRLSLKIGAHDLQVKAKKAAEFLEKGSRVRVTVVLKGREMIFKDRAIEMIDQFRQSLNAEYEQTPARLGNRFNAIIKEGKDHAQVENQ